MSEATHIQNQCRQHTSRTSTRCTGSPGSTRQGHTFLSIRTVTALAVQLGAAWLRRDTGVGMTREDLMQSLGTIARSGTAKFAEVGVTHKALLLH